MTQAQVSGATKLQGRGEARHTPPPGGDAQTQQLQQELKACHVALRACDSDEPAMPEGGDLEEQIQFLMSRLDLKEKQGQLIENEINQLKSNRTMSYSIRIVKSEEEDKEQFSDQTDKQLFWSYPDLSKKMRAGGDGDDRPEKSASLMAELTKRIVRPDLNKVPEVAPKEDRPSVMVEALQAKIKKMKAQRGDPPSADTTSGDPADTTSDDSADTTSDDSADTTSGNPTPRKQPPDLMDALRHRGKTSGDRTPDGTTPENTSTTAQSSKTNTKEEKRPFQPVIYWRKSQGPDTPSQLRFPDFLQSVKDVFMTKEFAGDADEDIDSAVEKFRSIKQMLFYPLHDDSAVNFMDWYEKNILAKDHIEYNPERYFRQSPAGKIYTSRSNKMHSTMAWQRSEAIRDIIRERFKYDEYKDDLAEILDVDLKLLKYIQPIQEFLDQDKDTSRGGRNHRDFVQTIQREINYAREEARMNVQQVCIEIFGLHTNTQDKTAAPSKLTELFAGMLWILVDTSEEGYPTSDKRHPYYHFAHTALKSMSFPVIWNSVQYHKYPFIMDMLVPMILHREKTSHNKDFLESLDQTITNSGANLPKLYSTYLSKSEELLLLKDINSNYYTWKNEENDGSDFTFQEVEGAEKDSFKLCTERNNVIRLGDKAEAKRKSLPKATVLEQVKALEKKVQYYNNKNENERTLILDASPKVPAAKTAEKEPAKAKPPSMAGVFAELHRRRGGASINE